MLLLRERHERGRARAHGPRQRRISLPTLALVAGLSCLPVSAFADFTVSQWGLGVDVDAQPGPSDGRGFYEVQNPFTGAHSASIPTAQAAAQYNISWLANYGSFNISAQLAAQDGNSVRSLASGTIYLQSDAVVMTLSLDAVLNYDLPTYGLDGYLSFAVRDLTSNQYILNEEQWYSTFTQPPGTGLLSLAPSVVLPADHQFRVQYEMLVQTSGYSASLATAPDAHVNFTLSPEPATIALLAALLLVLPRHRPRRTRAISP